GDVAFRNCTGLTAFTVATDNPAYKSLGGVLFDIAQTTLIQFPAGKTGAYAVPNTVKTIGDWAFANCSGLISITIGANVTRIAEEAFWGCSNLQAVFLKGNAPIIGQDAFLGDDGAIIYHVSGKTGWGATFGDRPTALWTAQAQTSDSSFGVGPNGFGFTITGPSNLGIIVEACTNLTNPAWVPVA